MMFPAKMKSGMASSEKLSTPLFIFCIVIKVIWSHVRDDIAVTIDATTILTEIGQLKNNNNPNTANKIIVVSTILLIPHSLLQS